MHSHMYDFNKFTKYIEHCKKVHNKCSWQHATRGIMTRWFRGWSWEENGISTMLQVAFDTVFLRVI